MSRRFRQMPHQLAAPPHAPPVRFDLAVAWWRGILPDLQRNVVD